MYTYILTGAGKGEELVFEMDSSMPPPSIGIEMWDEEQNYHPTGQPVSFMHDFLSKNEDFLLKNVDFII